MSIGKVGTVKSSANAIDYVLKERKGEKKPKLIGGNALGSTKQEIKDEFRHQETLNCKVQNTVVHIVISFPTNVEITDEFAAEYADRLMGKLGYGSNLYIVVRHFDKEDREEDPYAHLHVVGSRIRDDGNPISEWKSAERVIATTKEIDEEMGLESVEFLRNEGERNIKKDEYRVMQNRRELSVMETFKDVAEQTLAEINNTAPPENSAGQPRKINSFVRRIQEAGFEVLPSLDEETGEMRGFSFKKDHITFTASKGWKPAKWNNLKETVDYLADKDHQFLLGLKEEFLTRAAESAATTAETDSSREAVRIADHETESAARPAGTNRTKTVETSRTPDETLIREAAETGDISKDENLTRATNAVTEDKTGKIKTNEKTAELTTEPPKPEPVGRRITKTSAKSSDTPKAIFEVEGPARIEPETGLDEVKIERAEFAGNGNGRDGDAAARSAEFVVENPAGAAEIGGRVDSENRVADSRRKQAIVSNTNPDSIENGRVERAGRRDSGGGNDQESARPGSEIRQKADRENESGVPKFSGENQSTEAGFSSRLEFGGNVAPRNRDAEERAVEYGNPELQRANFFVERENQKFGESDHAVPPTIRKGERTGQEARKGGGEMGGSDFAESLKIVNRSADSGIGDNVLSLDDHGGFESRIKSGEITSGGNGETNKFIEKREGFIGEQMFLFDNEIETDVSRSRKFFGYAAGEAASGNSSGRKTDRQIAEITVQTINARHFSGQLNANIVAKWIDVVEGLNPKEFLEQVVKPKTEEEGKTHFTHLVRQSEIIADSLDLQKPEASLGGDPEKLALTLAGIETTNFEAATGNSISEKTFERLLADKLAVEDGPPTLEQKRKIKERFAEFTDVPAFSTKMEIEVFNALLDPETVEFDVARIIGIQEKVRTDEIAANETATLVQLAYGGQKRGFTDEFKSALIDEIHLQPEPATDIYNDVRILGWQSTVHQFSEIVGVLAEEYQIPLTVPSDDVGRNDLLAEFFAESLINSYQEANDSVEAFIKVKLLGMAVDISKMEISDDQTKMSDQNMEASLKPPVFVNALEAAIYNFGKDDSETQTKRSEQIIDYIYQAEQYRVEEQFIFEEQIEKQIEIEERQSNGLAI